MPILITGMGAVSCLGIGLREHRRAFSAGASGITEIREPGGVLPAGARIGHVLLTPDPLVSAEQPQSRVGLFLQRALAEALDDARLSDMSELALLSGCPVYIGSAHGNLDSWLDWRRGGSGGVSALWETECFLQAIQTRLSAPTLISTACTASAVAVGMAFDVLRLGDAEIAIVAGTESMTPFLYAGFESLRSLASGPCRPFDRERDGLVLGEGAAVLVLETDAHARRRGAVGVAEIAGYGFASDAAYLTAPDPGASGASSALRQAVAQAAFADPPDFINAHGTGTRLNDRMECIAIRRTFGEQAKRIPITSTKPLTGHLCGAAGAMEILSAAMALQSAVVPGILGFEHPDPEFIDFDFIRGPARSGQFTTAVSMNSGFGGTNTAIALKRWEP